ncbi:MAG: helix-turn-helix domain-containing protein [Candidatus Paceibacterales bacterium]
MGKDLQIRILSLLRRRGPMTRPKICEALGEPRSTVYDNIKKLEERNLVDSSEKEREERGRPKTIFTAI